MVTISGTTTDTQPHPPPLEPMMRLEQVLALVGCSRSTLYAGIPQGRYPAPIKNGKLSLWTTESVRAWLTNPSNFKTFSEAKRTVPRNLAKSAVFARKAEQMAEAERALETIALSILLAHYDRFCKEGRPSTYDKQSSETVKRRLADLKAGAPSSLHVLRRWRPSVQVRQGKQVSNASQMWTTSISEET